LLRLIQMLIENIDERDEEPKNEFHSINHYLIKQILYSASDSLSLSLECKESKIYWDICNGLSEANLSIVKASTTKIPRQLKKEYLEITINIYFELSITPFQDRSEEISLRLEEIILKVGHKDYVEHNYIELMRDAWHEFDKYPYGDHGNKSRIVRFNDKVLVPLGIGDK